MSASGMNSYNLPGVGDPETDRECPACARNTARLLLESVLYEFYYCYSCREWSKGRYPNPKTIFPVREIRLAKALTRFYVWRLESAYNVDLIGPLHSLWRRLKAALHSGQKRRRRSSQLAQ